MKAKIKPRIDLENRTKLETVIPLRTPFIVFIDPCDRCNFRCKFCPTSDRELMKNIPGRNYGNMDFDLYKSIIDGICGFEDKVKVIRLYGHGEPLMNPNFANMIEYAHKSGCCDRVDTTTNAALLTPELSDRIIHAGLNRINISVIGVNAEQYQEFSDYKIDFDAYINNIRYFYEHRAQCEMIVKINGDILTKEQKQQFYDVFGDITDGIFIESIMNCWPEYEYSKVDINETRGIYGQNIHEVSVCPYVFYSFMINSNGKASLCFLDWHHKLILGDCSIQSPVAIWNSEIFNDYRKLMLGGHRKSNEFCANCGQLSQGAPDNIDRFADKLFQKLL